MKVRLPDGRIANFPDTMSPDEVKAILRKKFPPKGTQTAAAGKMDAQTPPVDQGSDMLTGLKSGAMRGITGLGGMIGDAQQVMGNVASWGAEKLGASPETQRLAGDIAGRVAIPGLASRLPTSTQLQGAAETVTGPMARPETFAGQTIEKIGEFAPGAIAGPGGVLRKAALAAVPAVAAETAGRIPGIEGSGAQPYVEMGAALAAGMPIAAKSGAGKVMNDMRDAAPSLDKVRTATDSAYTNLRSAGIIYRPQDYNAAAMKMESRLRKLQVKPGDSGEAVDLLNRVKALRGNKAAWADVEEILKDAKEVLRSGASKTEKKRAGVIVDELSGLVKTGKLVSPSGRVPKDEISGMIGEAQELGRRKILAEQIEEMKFKMPGYVSGEESAMRNQFGSYLRNPKAHSLTDAERNAFIKVNRREGLLNAAHMAGSRIGQAVTGPITGGLGALAGSTFGIPGTIAGYAVGQGVGIAGNIGFRKLMDKITERAVDDALKTVLAGRAAQKIATSAAEKERIRASIRASLLAAQAAPEPANTAPGQPAIMAP